MAKISLGLPLQVIPDSGARPFIKSVELVLGEDTVIGELYVHPCTWDDPTDERAARREARRVLKKMLAP